MIEEKVWQTTRKAMLKFTAKQEGDMSTIYLDKYLLSKLDDGQIEITIIGDGEGGIFSLQEFEKVVDKFYNDNF